MRSAGASALPDPDAACMRARRAPTLIVASAADRLLPSLEESRRLVGAIPDARRVVLPTSGHTALLESGVCLAAIMARTGFLPARPAQQVCGCVAGRGSQPCTRPESPRRRNPSLSDD